MENTETPVCIETATLEDMLVTFRDPIASYTGEHLNGLPNGLGVEESITGSKLSCKYHKGQGRGEATLHLANCFIYNGIMLVGFAHGDGTLTKDGKTVYVGLWREGFYRYGVLTHSNGVKYSGPFII